MSRVSNLKALFENKMKEDFQNKPPSTLHSPTLIKQSIVTEKKNVIAEKQSLFSDKKGVAEKQNIDTNRQDIAVDKQVVTDKSLIKKSEPISNLPKEKPTSSNVQMDDTEKNVNVTKELHTENIHPTSISPYLHSYQNLKTTTENKTNVEEIQKHASLQKSKEAMPAVTSKNETMNQEHITKNKLLNTSNKAIDKSPLKLSVSDRRKMFEAKLNSNQVKTDSKLSIQENQLASTLKEKNISKSTTDVESKREVDGPPQLPKRRVHQPKLSEPNQSTAIDSSKQSQILSKQTFVKASHKLEDPPKPTPSIPNTYTQQDTINSVAARIKALESVSKKIPENGKHDIIDGSVAERQIHQRLELKSISQRRIRTRSSRFGMEIQAQLQSLQ